MYAVRWNVKVLDKYQYAMENPACVTERFCKAMLFTTAWSAEEFRKSNHLDYFTVVEVAEDAVLKDMKVMVSEMQAKARSDFREAVLDAKSIGIGVEELHAIVEEPNFVR